MEYNEIENKIKNYCKLQSNDYCKDTVCLRCMLNQIYNLGLVPKDSVIELTEKIKSLMSASTSEFMLDKIETIINKFLED